MAKRKMMQTPKGVFKYTHVNKPDYRGAERFGGDPMYRTTFVIEKDAKGFDKFMQDMEELHQAAFREAQKAFDEAPAKTKAAWKKKNLTEPTLNDWFTDEVDEDGEPTGRIEMKLKTHSQFTDKETGKVTKKTVPFYDGRGQIIPTKKRPLVYAGSEGRVKFTTAPQFIPKDADCYLGLYLSSLQITALGSGGDTGFDADEESDFSVDDLEEIEANADDDDPEDGDLGDDGDLGSGNNPPDDDDDDDLDDEIPF